MELKMKNAIAATVAAVAVGAYAPSASAFEVEEPDVEKGKVQIEVHGSYQDGFPDDEDAEVTRHTEEIAIGYGITSYFSLAVEAEYEEERDEEGDFSSIRLSEIGAEGKLVLVPIEDDGFGASFYVAYEESVVSDEDESALTFGPIFKVAQGPWSATVNTFFVRAFEASEEEDDEVEITPEHWDFSYAWQVKYKINERFGVGVEGYGDLKDISDELEDETYDEHRIGPVLYISFGDDDDGDGDDDDEGSLKDTGLEEEELEISAAIGVLFGVNNHTSDVTLKWDFEVEF